MSARAGAAEPIRIGVSSCLLGEKVRFDGGHRRDPFLADTLGAFVEWVPVCPEVEIGMGTPREPIRLVLVGDEIRLLAPGSGRDWTAAMRAWAARRVASLEPLELCGYVLKGDSPSCGMERVGVHRGGGRPRREGRGVFAEALLERFPDLPVEEEGWLADPRRRDGFVERVFACRRLRSLFSGRWTVGALVAFHAAHKLQLMSHSPAAYAALGRLVAGAKGAPRDELRASYGRQFMAGLAAPATPRRHVNVLQHVAGYFKRRLDDGDRDELHAHIEDYRRGLVPLAVPVTLVRRHVRRLGIAYLAGQTYLEPHPLELMLRDHV